MSGEYTFKVADIAGNMLAELPLGNPVWTFALNAEGSATFTLPIHDPKADPNLLSVGDRDLYIYADGDLKWAGRIWNIEASTSNNEIRCSALGWFSIFKRRFVTANRSYDNEEQFDIAWDLIDHSQDKTGGDVGIVNGSGSPSGVLRDRKFFGYELSNIHDEIVAMTELQDGFDFEITPEKQFIAYYPMKGDDVDFPLELGKNVATIATQEDALDLANSVYAVGAGDGDATCIANAIDATSRTTYGLLEAVESFTEIKQFTTLQSRANSQLKVLKHPRITPNIYIVLGADQDYYDYVVGDRVHVKADYGYLQIDDDYRIITMTYQLTNDGREAVTLGFDAEISV